MVIEASVFRDPVDQAGKPFDLAAFRDLLLLHALAQSNARGGPVNSNLAPLGGAEPFVPSRPASAAAGRSGTPRPVQEVDIALETQNGMVAPAGSPVGLDVDLNDLVASSKLPSEEETAFPNLPPVPSAVSATGDARLESAMPAQAIEDNSFLDFDNATVNYKLPGKKS
jgi:hypothetical protein